MAAFTPTVPATTRIQAFDGLRGVAAAIVVLHHYLCLLHPNLVPTMGAELVRVADTPLHFFWNGRFAVTIFFALSGYVMAAAADRRPKELLTSCVTRYLRLALPVTASCLAAWIWLSAFPDAAQTLQQTVDNPSRWLDYTYQEPILPVWYAAADGMIGNFIRGFSRFNNVLWTMKFELLGSIGIFFLYFFSTQKNRLMVLLVSAFLIVRYLPDSYFAFVLGAGIYEAHKRNAFQRPPAYLPVIALISAILLGSPGEGAHERLYLPEVPAQWELGRPSGLISVLAAGLLLYAVLMLPPLARVLSTRLPVFLGRISFGLYLVHVPPLYTIVAWSTVQGVQEPVIAIVYAFSTIILAYGFTLLVDEPVLSRVSAMRTKIKGRIAGRKGTAESHEG